MTTTNNMPHFPEPSTNDHQMQGLLRQLPHAERIPHESNDEAFDAPWELRALALGIAAHYAGRYAWKDFQRALISSIREWETSKVHWPWQYYERWLVAMESLLAERDVVSREELDSRTQVVLNTPRDASHQRRHPEPVAIDSGTSSPHPPTRHSVRP
jgi:nitrile hydratase accessory protein